MPPRNFSVGEKAPKGTFKKSMSKLFRYCRFQMWPLILSMIFGSIGVACQIVGPNLIGDVTDYIQEGLMGADVLNQISQLCFTLVAIYIVMALLQYLQQYIMNNVTQNVVRRFRTDISRKINRLPLNYFDTHLYGDVLSRVTNDVDTLGQSMNESIANLLSNIILFIGVLVMMFVTQWIMALTVIGTTIIGFAFSSIFLLRAQKYFDQNQKNLADINAHVEEVYSGHNVVQLFNAKETQSKEFEKINKKLFYSGWKSQFISGVMMPVMSFTGNLGYVAVCVVGAVLIATQGLGYGVIASFMIYVRLFSNPLSQIAQSLTRLQSTSAAANRVFEFLESPELETPVLNVEDVKGNVEFDHVKFGYNEDKIIIKDFSAKIKKGQKVAIVGPTGAGKTTLVNLLMRFYEINSGDIRIDGIPTRYMTRENVHALFGMVLQDTWLFEGTIKENLRYNNENVTDEQIYNACKQVGVDHFIQTLSKGYDTKIDDTVNLSAGQKQLLTIARTMIQNRPMLILDEATSSVDTRTEILLQKAMDKVMEGRTSFIIAHRLSTIKNADMILVLKDGDIIESGTHNQLLKKGGFYADLYNSQFDEK
ncbi:MAG: ABC transporter ATP-binding protein/permease [Clostridia bacterium]|nr:ABC transporter ATP-binding protein/permease [Clostridia bacterium]